LVDRRKRRQRWEKSHEKKPRPKEAMRLEGAIDRGQCWIDVLLGDPATALVNGVPDPSRLIEVRALIDTGATSTSITTDLANQIGLVVRTTARVSGVGGTHSASKAPAIVGFRQPDRVLFRILPVLILTLDPPVRMLWGMSDLMAGTLHVDGPGQRWLWSISDSSVRQRGQ